MVKRSLPRKNNGLIDGERLLYIATVRLKLPYGALDEYTPGEIMTLNEYYLEDQREHYELTAYAFATGYASVKKGRRIKMFDDRKEESKGRVTKVQKKAELDYLKGLF